MNKILLLLALLLGGTCVWSQTATISKLSYQYHHAESQDKKREVLLALLDQYRSMDRDSLYFFVQELKSHDEGSLAVANQLEANFYLVYYYSYKGWVDSGFSVIDQSLTLASNVPDAERYEMMYAFSRGGLLVKSGRPQDALIWYFTALPIADKLADTAFQIKILNGVGWGYMEMNLFRESVNWFKKAAALAQSEPYRAYLAYVYSNTASSYGGLQRLDSAAYYIRMALNSAKQNDDLFSLANALAINANILFEQGQQQAAIDSMNSVLALRELLNDPLYIVADMVLLSQFYSESGRTEEGLPIALEAVRLAKEVGSLNRLQMAYQSLAKHYETRGDYQALAAVRTTQLKIADSLAKIGSFTVLAEMQSKYNMAQSEKEVAQLEAKTAAQELQLQREKNARKITIFLTTVLVLVSFGVWLYFSQKSKADIQQSLLKAIFETEQRERLRIARDLHDSIGQLLSVVKIQVSNMKNSLPRIQVANIDNTINLVDKTIHEVRTISHNLIPEELNFGLEAALDDLVDAINDSTQTQVVFNHQKHLSEKEPDNALALSVYRIVQEIISNMLRHSDAQNIAITMVYKEKNILLNISDDGKGFTLADMKASVGIGWKNINARLQLLNGKIALSSEEKMGTHIEIMIPHGGTS